VKTLLLLIVSTLVFSGCSQREQSQAESPDNKRFKALEKFEFLGNEAQVIVDNETGIKYLYIWEGGSNGGPAITRLWSK